MLVKQIKIMQQLGKDLKMEDGTRRCKRVYPIKLHSL